MISETNHSRAWSFLLCQHRNESESPHWLQGADRQVLVSAYRERQTRPRAVAGSTASATRSPFPASHSRSQFPQWWGNGDKDIVRTYHGADAVREWGVQLLCVCREGDTSGPGPGPPHRPTAWTALLPACGWRGSFLEGQWFFENFFSFFLSYLLD